MPAALLGILLVTLAARIPYLANATPFFNSDEAANALLIKHLLNGRELRLYPWDATYYGIVEGLIAIPFVWTIGLKPVAFKLAAVTGHLLLILGTFLLGRRLFGPAEGLIAAFLLALFSPRLIQWSAFATGGLVLIVAWGTFTFLFIDRLRRAPSGWGVVALGVIAGFGLYLYELYVVYLAVLAIGAIAGSFAWKAMLAASPADSKQAFRSAPKHCGAAILFLIGLAVGWAPKLLSLAAGESVGKAPVYAFAGPQQIAANVELLFTRCILSLLGTNPAGATELEQWVGPTRALSPFMDSLLLATWGIAWLWGLIRNRKDLAGVFRRPPGVPRTESLLALLLPVSALLFVFSPNARDVHSDHYLLPWLTSLPLFAGSMIVRTAQRARGLPYVLALILIGVPAVHITIWYQDRGVLDQHLRLVRHRESLLDVLDYLRRRGIAGGYSWYWVAYKATFLSNEEIVIAPLWDWDRYPTYTQRADALPTEAYIFEYQRTSAGERLDERHAEFIGRLGAAKKPYEDRRIGKFLVYTSEQAGRRLFLPLRPLSRPRARVVVLRAFTAVLPGSVVEVPVRLTNLGNEPWSATGDAIGVHRVDLSYRWVRSDGTPSVQFDGKRTLLPADVYPGESVEISARVAVPSSPGDYRLVLSPVQEGVAWFVDVGGGSAELAVHVAAGGVTR